MHVLIGIALKSLLIAGLTLGLLKLMKSRSAAERSWVAHVGLLALVIMASAPLVLPTWNIETPLISATADTPQVVQNLPATATTSTVAATTPTVPVTAPAVAPATSALPSLSAAAAATALYAIPAAI